MDAVHVRSADLHLGNQLLAVAAAGDRGYVGRGLSDDQARENVAVVAGGARRLVRDSDAPLPLGFGLPTAGRPRSSVTALVASERHHKLYVAANLEDPAARPRRLITTYDLDDDGDPVVASLRTHRADVAGFSGGVEVEQLALDPVGGALYFTGGKWSALRYYRLDAAGDPIGDQPAVLPLTGSPIPSLAVNELGTRLYLGRHPRTLTVLAVQDGVPQPRSTVTSALPGLDLGGDGYLRIVHTPGALLAVRSRATLTGAAPAQPVPLYLLPLDPAGDPAAPDWQRLDGYDHLLLAPAADRLWLATSTGPDGYQLVEYATEHGRPTTEVARGPVQWGQQPILAAAPVVVSRTVPATDHAAGETLRFRIRGPAAAYQCTVFGPYSQLSEPLAVADGELSAPVALDRYLAKQPGQVPIRLRFAAAAPAGEVTVEAHWNGQVARDTVRGPDVQFLLPGYAVLPPDGRPARFQPFSARWSVYRKVAEALALRPDERPDRYVVSAFSMVGGQGHRGQLDDGVATLRALGVNSVQLVGWTGIPAAELTAAADGFTPEVSVYAPPLYSPFLFAYDGSLTDSLTDKVIDADYLRAWAAGLAAGSPAGVVRFQLADEPGWYLPGVLGLLDPADPALPVNQHVRWTDPQQRNAAWVARFAEHVEATEPGLIAALGADWTGRPIGASAATTAPLRRLHQCGLRFFTDQAAEGVRRLHTALQDAYGPQVRVHVNFGEALDRQWHKPYPDAVGDKNPDSGPDAATGGYDWFRLGRTPVLPSKHSYTVDSGAQVWSCYADLLRSAAPEFTAFVPGSRLGDLGAGAAYKVLSVVSRGATMLAAYAFGPEFLFVPPNSWAENLRAYPAIADALRLVGRTQDVLHPGVPEQGRIAIHLPAASRVWDRQPAAPAYHREVLPLHTALVHDGYAVDFVDGPPGGEHRVLYLLGPNLPAATQRTVARWVQAGGTLVVLPGAATADEADQPTPILDELLGVTGRAAHRAAAHPATGFGLSRTLAVTDPGWLAALDSAERPLRDVWNLSPVAPAPAPGLQLTTAAAVATVGGVPAVSRRAVGRGVAYAYAFHPGWQYWCSATHPVPTIGLHTDRLPAYWADQDRLLAVLPARLAGVPRSVQVDRAAVEVRRLESAAGTAVVLFNWTGAPIGQVEVAVEDAGRRRRVTSARHGRLTDRTPDSGRATVRLPLADVDVLTLTER